MYSVAPVGLRVQRRAKHFCRLSRKRGSPGKSLTIHANALSTIIQDSQASARLGWLALHWLAIRYDINIARQSANCERDRREGRKKQSSESNAALPPELGGPGHPRTTGQWAGLLAGHIRINIAASAEGLECECCILYMRTVHSEVISLSPPPKTRQLVVTTHQQNSLSPHGRPGRERDRRF